MTSAITTGTTTYTYDNDGNQLTTETPTNAITTNVWDYENRLQSVALPSNKTITYTYAITRRNGEEMRVKKDDGSSVTKYIWDAANIVSETNELDIVTADFTYNPMAYGNLISMRRNSTTSFYHFDALGSTQALTDASETITDSYLYNAFGEVINSSGSTINPYQYVGEAGYYYNTDTGLHTLRRREYNTTDGRFASFDPIHFAAGDVNLYRYVTNNPNTNYDPSGLRMNTREEFLALFRLRNLRKTAGELLDKTPSNRQLSDYYNAINKTIVHIESTIKKQANFDGPNYSAAAAPWLLIGVADGPIPIGDAIAIVGIGVTFLTIWALSPPAGVDLSTGLNEMAAELESVLSRIRISQNEGINRPGRSGAGGGRQPGIDPATAAAIATVTIVVGIGQIQKCKKRERRRCRCSVRLMPDPIREKHNCPDRVYGSGFEMGECQKLAKQTAPVECRAFYGHCSWIK